MKRVACVTSIFALCLVVTGALFSQSSEAPAGFDGQTNGLVDQNTFIADQEAFDEVEKISDGLGPLYNAQSCRECHQNPVSGGASQVAELRVGHRDARGYFQNPSIPIGDGKAMITGRSLVNDRAICPNTEFPDLGLQEHVPDSETIRAPRMTVSILGDGFVEAVSDQALLAIAAKQCSQTGGRICGQAVYVPFLEAPDQVGIGRFGWKDQQASLLSFAADAYLNEMGITNKLFPDEVTELCNTVSEPNNAPGPDGLEDIDRFARFMRATKAPSRDATLAATPEAQEGSRLFHAIGCDTCHVTTLVTAPAGSAIDGGTVKLPDALGSKTFHPYSDYLLHDIGTGDGIPISVQEHFGRAAMRRDWQNKGFQNAANKIRTAPLWGVRTRSHLLHDGYSLTLTDAILNHKGEALIITQKFKALAPEEKAALISFLDSL